MNTNIILNLIQSDNEIASLFGHSHTNFDLSLIIGEEQDS